MGAIAIWYRQGTGITGMFSCRLGYMLVLSIKYCRFYTEYKLSIDGIKYFVHRVMNSKTESHTLQNRKDFIMVSSKNKWRFFINAFNIHSQISDFIECSLPLRLM